MSINKDQYIHEIKQIKNININIQKNQNENNQSCVQLSQRENQKYKKNNRQDEKLIQKSLPLTQTTMASNKTLLNYEQKNHINHKKYSTKQQCYTSKIALQKFQQKQKQSEQTNSTMTNSIQCPMSLETLKSLPRVINKNPHIKIECKTQFPLVRSIALQQFGWTELVRQDHRQNVDIIWQDGYVTQQLVNRLRSYQKINHFPYSNQMGRKDYLFMNLNKIKDKFKEQYDFFPKTWIFPQDFDKFKKQSSGLENKQFFYIIKPVSSCQGKGIYLSKRSDILHSFQQSSKLLIQQYMQDPLLIDGLKFDLRIYVVIKSLNPLVIYIYEQGLTRLATNLYEKPDKNNYKNGRMHLTNYAINKNNPQFIHNKDFKKDNIGHKRSLRAFYQQIQKQGANSTILKQKIKNIIIKTILAVYDKMNSTQKLPKFVKDIITKTNNNNHNNEQKSLQHQNQFYYAKDTKVFNPQLNKQKDTSRKIQDKCFQLLGFDILIQKDYEPKLIQINHQPSLQTGSPLDFVIKKYLLIDLFNLLNMKSQYKQQYLAVKRQPENKGNKIRQTQIKCIINKQIKNKQKQILLNQVGAFQLIYPNSNCQNMKIYHKIIPSLGQQYKNINKRKNYHKQQLKQSNSKQQNHYIQKFLTSKNIKSSSINKRKSYICNMINMSANDRIKLNLLHNQQIDSYFNPLNNNKNQLQHYSNSLLEQNNKNNVLQENSFSCIHPSTDRSSNMKKNRQMLIAKKNLNFTIKYKSQINSSRRNYISTASNSNNVRQGQNKQVYNYSNLINLQFKTIISTNNFSLNNKNIIFPQNNTQINIKNQQQQVYINPYLQPYLRNYSHQAQRRAQQDNNDKKDKTKINKQMFNQIKLKDKNNKKCQFYPLQLKIFNPDNICDKKISFQSIDNPIQSSIQYSNNNNASSRNNYKNDHLNNRHQIVENLFNSKTKNSYLDHLCQREMFSRFQKIRSMKQKIQRLKVVGTNKNQQSKQSEVFCPNQFKLNKQKQFYQNKNIAKFDHQNDLYFKNNNNTPNSKNNMNLHVNLSNLNKNTANSSQILNTNNIKRSIQMFQDQNIIKSGKK